MNLKPFQLRDYARVALHDGAIVAHDTGLGKSWLAFLFSMLKLGVDIGEYLTPKGSALLVVPGELHRQMIDEGSDRFFQRVIPLDSQDTFLRYANLQGGRYILPPGYYITSYTQLSSNGVSKPPEEFIENVGSTSKKGIKCIYTPSMADLCWNTFDCVVIDEGVKMKGEDTLIGKGVRKLDPKYRLVLTATPVKNRLPDIFRLAWWATGGKTDAHARWPYADDSDEREEFSKEFMVSERNLTAERKYAAETGKHRRFKKLTPQVCSIHRLWKLFGPIILRRRKQDCGEEIVPKIRHVIRVPMGKHQTDVYRYHLDAHYIDKNDRPAIGSKLQALRVAAADPTSPLLHQVDDGKSVGTWHSSQPYTPKMASALNLIAQILERGEQVVVFSAFNDPSNRLSSWLEEAGVDHMMLDGRTSQKRRGDLSSQFKAGRIPVMLAGVDSMSEGHSWHLCSNVILLAYSWAYDKFEQAINRVHRLTSPKPVHVYSVICQGSIDRKLEQLIQEKGDAAELVLDGRLLTESASEVNLSELLNIARSEFSEMIDADMMDESQLVQEWPAIKARLTAAAAIWKKTEAIAA